MKLKTCLTGLLALLLTACQEQNKDGLKTSRFEDLVRANSPVMYQLDTRKHSPVAVRMSTNQNYLSFLISQGEEVIFDSSQSVPFWQGRVQDDPTLSITVQTQDEVANTQSFPFFLEVDHLPGAELSATELDWHKRPAIKLDATLSSLMGNPPYGYGIELMTYLSAVGDKQEQRLVSLGSRIALRIRQQEQPAQVWFHGSEFQLTEGELYPSQRLWNEEQLSRVSHCKSPGSEYAIPNSLLQVGSRLLVCQAADREALSNYRFLIRQRLGGALPHEYGRKSVPLKSGSQIIAIIWSDI